MPVDNVTLLGRLGVALALGLLIGMERGWQLRELPEGQRVAGFRTFGLIGLLGGVTVLLAAQSQGLFLSAVVAVLGAAVVLGYWRESAPGEDISVTSTIETASLPHAHRTVSQVCSRLVTPHRDRRPNP